MRRLAFQPKSDARYRTIPETRIVAMLLLVSWACEIDAGDRRAAEASTAAALDGWVARGLGHALTADGQRLFDPVEVVNFVKWAGLAGIDRYWEDHFVATHRRFVDEFRGERPPRRFGVRLRRSFDLRGFAEGARVRLRLPLPLAGSYLADLSVTPVLPEPYRRDAVLREQCLELRLTVPDDRGITIGADFLFTAHDPAGRSAPLTAQEAELYCRPSEGLIRVTPRIEALAADLAGQGTSARGAVAAFWDYMMDELCSGMIRYGDVPADAPGDWVLDNGWYDCQLGSALLVSLCRARGIPARIVSGYCLYRVQPISHYWSEIWLDDAGWCPFDVICWDLSKAGREAAWRHVFAGRMDYRLVTQCFPLVFTGPMSLHFPQAWHMVQVVAGTGAAGTGVGIETDYTDAGDGSLIYRDHVAVETLDAAHDNAVLRTFPAGPDYAATAPDVAASIRRIVDCAANTQSA